MAAASVATFVARVLAGPGPPPPVNLLSAGDELRDEAVLRDGTEKSFRRLRGMAARRAATFLRRPKTRIYATLAAYLLFVVIAVSGGNHLVSVYGQGGPGTAEAARAAEYARATEAATRTGRPRGDDSVAAYDGRESIAECLAGAERVVVEEGDIELYKIGRRAWINEATLATPCRTVTAEELAAGVVFVDPDREHPTKEGATTEARPTHRYMRIADIVSANEALLDQNEAADFVAPKHWQVVRGAGAGERREHGRLLGTDGFNPCVLTVRLEARQGSGAEQGYDDEEEEEEAADWFADAQDENEDEPEHPIRPQLTLPARGSDGAAAQQQQQQQQDYYLYVTLINPVVSHPGGAGRNARKVPIKFLPGDIYYPRVTYVDEPSGVMTVIASSPEDPTTPLENRIGDPKTQVLMTIAADRALAGDTFERAGATAPVAPPQLPGRTRVAARTGEL